jgi:hypothetical protein
MPESTRHARMLWVSVWQAGSAPLVKRYRDLLDETNAGIDVHR